MQLGFLSLQILLLVFWFVLPGLPLWLVFLPSIIVLLTLTLGLLFTAFVVWYDSK